jgi:excinuclease ABC subunit C
MVLDDYKKLKIPDAPGVYTFWQKTPQSERILYVGRATSLKDRVRSYFNDDLIATRGPLLVDMVSQAATISWQETDSVLEAVLLEAAEIKKHQPYFNTKEKDNKSFSIIVLTDEAFPRVLMMRERDQLLGFPTLTVPVKTVYGPYPHAGIIKQALTIIRKIFPYRDNSCTPGQGRACFNRHLGLCPGVCTGEISSAAYKRSLKRLELFLQGQKSKLINDIERSMNTAAKAQQFEEAARLRTTLYNVQHIQDISLIKREEAAHTAGGFRIEAYDVAHTAGRHIAGIMTVIENNTPARSQYRKFRLRTIKQAHETAAVQEIVERRLAHPEWPYPQLFVADGNEVQLGAIEKVLAHLHLDIPVVSVVKDERHKPKDILPGKHPQAAALIQQHRAAILLANNEAHRASLAYHRLLRGRLFK